MANWTPQSWRQAQQIVQDVNYSDQKRNVVLPQVISKLRALPPLVTPAEIERLRTQLAAVAEGKAFLLQGGDCAESFDYCSQKPIEGRVALLLLMSLVIIHGARLPVVRILRGAGQYAKPRSSPTEVVEGKTIPSFRGDNVNGFSVDDREPDPERLLQAYFHSVATLNHIRGLLGSGFADLHHPRDWSLSHVRSAELYNAFEEIIERLEDSLDFLRVIGADDPVRGSSSVLQNVELYTSHEGLLLEYEEALTRVLESPLPTGAGSGLKHAYNTSAHFLWIGDRTRQINGAHVEYFRGIRNPIGLKCGPTLTEEELLRLLDILDPNNEPGRVTLICRYGVSKVEACLPRHIKAVRRSGHRPIFCCDPMHGNTQTSESGVKTRHLADIVVEISKSFEIHAALGSKLHGVHLEMTSEVDASGFSVTECVGGSMELEDADLSLRYQSFCDPRLNQEQSLDIAFLVSNFYQNERKGRHAESDILKGLRSRGSSSHQDA